MEKDKSESKPESQRALQHRTCTSKIIYLTRGVANKAAKETHKKYGPKMRAYKCRFCIGYHIGHDYTAKFKKGWNK